MNLIQRKPDLKLFNFLPFYSNKNGNKIVFTIIPGCLKVDCPPLPRLVEQVVPHQHVGWVPPQHVGWVPLQQVGWVPPQQIPYLQEGRITSDAFRSLVPPPIQQKTCHIHYELSIDNASNHKFLISIHFFKASKAMHKLGKLTKMRHKWEEPTKTIDCTKQSNNLLLVWNTECLTMQPPVLRTFTHVCTFTI